MFKVFSWYFFVITYLVSKTIGYDINDGMVHLVSVVISPKSFVKHMVVWLFGYLNPAREKPPTFCHHVQRQGLG